MEKPDTARPDDLYFTIAFYGIDGSEEAAIRFFHEVATCFEQHGCPPDKLCVNRGTRNGRIIGFQRGMPNLLRKGLRCVNSVSINTMLPDWQFFSSSFLCSAEWSVRPNYITICMHASLLENMDPMGMPVVREFVDVLSPEYGIGYFRKFSMGPNFFAIGLNYGNQLARTAEEHEEEMQISRWGYSATPRKLWREGIIRDVFPWNFLTASQLQRKVKETNQSLEEWIRSDPDRGTLQDLPKAVKLWTVAEENIKPVREVLWKNRSIYDYHVHDKSSGPPLTPEEADEVGARILGIPRQLPRRNTANVLYRPGEIIVTSIMFAKNKVVPCSPRSKYSIIPEAAELGRIVLAAMDLCCKEGIEAEAIKEFAAMIQFTGAADFNEYVSSWDYIKIDEEADGQIAVYPYVRDPEILGGAKNNVSYLMPRDPQEVGYAVRQIVMGLPIVCDKTDDAK